MKRLRSFDASGILYGDLKWLLAQAPELKELSFRGEDANVTSEGTPSVRLLSHSGLERLFQRSSVWDFDCPSLSTISDRRPYYAYASIPSLPRTTPSVTHFEMPSLRPLTSHQPLPTLTHLAILYGTYDDLSSFADILHDTAIPLLQSLQIYTDYATTSEQRPEDLVLAYFENKAAFAFLMDRLVAPRCHGAAKIQVVDIRFKWLMNQRHRQPQVLEGLFQTLRLLHQQTHERTGSVSSQIPQIPLKVGIKSIRKAINGGQRVCSAQCSCLLSS